MGKGWYEGNRFFSGSSGNAETLVGGIFLVFNFLSPILPYSKNIIVVSKKNAKECQRILSWKLTPTSVKGTLILFSHFIEVSG